MNEYMPGEVGGLVEVAIDEHNRAGEVGGELARPFVQRIPAFKGKRREGMMNRYTRCTADGRTDLFQA